MPWGEVAAYSMTCLVPHFPLASSHVVLMIRMGTGQGTDSIPYDLHSPRLDTHVLRCSVLVTSVGAMHGCVIVEHLADS